MKQELANELDGVHGQGTGLIPVGAILPAERDFPVIEGNEALMSRPMREFGGRSVREGK